jgi:hypothetical protein
MTHTSSDIQLPFDVIHLIISELANDADMGSMKACSLTCKTILPLARKHIFAKVEIHNSYGYVRWKKPPLNRFKWLLDSDPSIADYIRSFEYVEYNDHYSPPWPVLRNATSLKFDAGLWKKGWGKLAGSLRTSFVNFISSNSITELYLFCISDFPISIFLQIPCLVRLEIHYLSFVDTKDPHPGSFQKTKLTRFLINDISVEDLRVLLGGPATMFDLTQLQELSIGFPNESLDADVVDSLISSSGMLRTLNIRGASCNFNMNLPRLMYEIPE